MGLFKHQKKSAPEPSSDPEKPVLARRSLNRKSTLVAGRTIGEAREHLETANERAAIRKKDKKRKYRRVSFTIFGFLIIAVILLGLSFYFIDTKDSAPINETTTVNVSTPTIEIIDEDATADSKITSRMKNYIGQFESDLRELGYQPIKAVVPSGSIRTINLYLDGYSGFIRATIDRDSAVSAEDADRLIRYLKSQGTTDFSYLDVRLDGKAYWK